MKKIKIYDDLVIGETDERLFSSFIEHMGRAIYTGIYEPDHPTADEQGFRTDVLDLVKQLNVEYIRYPGGNFLSGYRWKDGIGDNRPTRIDYAWRSIETNKIGINEFADWSKKAGTKIMGAVNLGTGTPQDAADFIEYCNFPGGTELSDLRKSHGYEKPHNIDIWCLGNEMDGDWQTCALDADDYGKKARETAKIMKSVDADIELVLVGSSSPREETYPEWDRKVLEYCYEQIDYLSMHIYYENPGNDQEFLTSAIDLDKFIKSVAATTDYVKTLKRSDKQIYLSLDEWNIWNYHVWNNSGTESKPMTDLEHHPRLLEDNYTYLEGVVFSSLIVTILNNSDRIKIACLAQLVNVIAPIFTEIGGRVIKQAIYYPFELFTTYGKGKVLKMNDDLDVLTTQYGSGKQVQTACVYDQEKQELNIFATNVDLENDVEFSFDFTGFENATFIEQYDMVANELDAVNTFDNPDMIQMIKSTELSTTIKKCSFSLYRFKI